MPDMLAIERRLYRWNIKYRSQRFSTEAESEVRRDEAAALAMLDMLDDQDAFAE